MLRSACLLSLLFSVPCHGCVPLLPVPEGRHAMSFVKVAASMEEPGVTQQAEALRVSTAGLRVTTGEHIR